MNKTIEKALASMEQAMAAARTQLAAETDRLESAARLSTCPPIAEVKLIKLPTGVSEYADIDRFDDLRSSFGVNKARAISAAEAALALAKQTVEEQHSANEAAIANNQEVRQKAQAFMTHIGIPPSKTTYGYATPKARKMTTQTKIAGYMSDLTDNIRIDDGYSSAKRVIEAFERRLAAYKDTKRAEDSAKELEAEKQRKKAEQMSRLVRLMDKYGITDGSLPTLELCNQVRQAILSKDKYLELASSLEAVRVDSSIGVSRIQKLLASFELVTAEDNDIVEDLTHLCDDFEGDGRVFRDCKYNYAFLQSKAPDELLSDYSELQSLQLLA